MCWIPIKTRGRDAGLSLIEVTVAIVVLTMIASSLVRSLLTTYGGTRTLSAKAFAFSKAQSLLAEVQSYANRSLTGAPVNLDALDDAGSKIPILTTLKINGSLVAPDHPLSENLKQNGQWVWSRTISVRGFTGAEHGGLRYVSVKIFKKNRDGHDLVQANVSTVIQASSTVYPTTQVYDLYLLNIESIPGWWVNMETMAPFADAIVTELESQNPGLELRVHWITKAGYGRDPVYRPYVNVSQPTTADTVTGVYYYPGLLPTGSDTTYYYPPDRFKARMSFDGVEVNGYDAQTNPVPYALADYYNHCMRLPRARALHAARLSAIEKRKQEIEQAKAAGTTPPAPLSDMNEEPTLQMLLEDLNSDPLKYRSAMIVNLHGEMLPMPPLRNYSDAAKLPSELPGIRVVTHPEKLHTARDLSDTASESVRLRVYSWLTEPDNVTLPDAMPETHPIMLEVMGMNLVGAGGKLLSEVTIENLRGGPLVGATRAYSPMTAAKHKSDSSLLPGEMYYDASFGNPDGAGYRTMIRLYNTPVRCRHILDDGTEVTSDASARGLAKSTAARLYGLEYVPSCVGGTDFSKDLSAQGTGTKNTARWVITIPGSAFPNKRFVTATNTPYRPANDDVMVTVRTRILSPSLTEWWKSGAMYPTPTQPENFSETYTWWTADPNVVPFTERFQIIGDPRHNPYQDLLNGDPNFGNGYNWYHDALTNGAEDARPDFPGLDPTRLATTWQGRQRFDVPALLRILRRGVTESKVVFTPMVGLTFCYIGLGNEIFDNPVNLRPWGEPLVTATVNNVRDWASSKGDILNYRCLVRASNTSGFIWWGIPWLGELYPDSVYATQWGKLDPQGKMIGNLLPGSGVGEFYRDLASNVYTSADPIAAGDKPSPTNSIKSGDSLTNDQYLESKNAQYRLYFQSDGNLVLKDSLGTVLWASNTAGSGADQLKLQTDGNLVMRASGTAVWSSTTAGTGATRLVLNNDGSLALYDKKTAYWSVNGTGMIATGVVGNTYRAYGTDLANSNQLLATEGCTTFYNIASRFKHDNTGESLPLTADGQSLVTNYNLKVPSNIFVNRPFELSTAGTFPIHWNLAPYSTNRYTANVLLDYVSLNSSGRNGSSLIELVNPAGTSSGFIVSNGIAESSMLGTDLIAKYVVTSMLHSLLHLTTSGNASSPLPIPRVQILAPSIFAEFGDPTSIDIKHDISWKRWDGKKYTPDTLDGFSADDSGVVYAITWSRDAGRTWHYVQDNSLAQVGQTPSDPSYRIPDWNSGAAETYTLATPSSTFPGGAYLVRVEAHYEGQLHYAWHQIQIFINR